MLYLASLLLLFVTSGESVPSFTGLQFAENDKYSEQGQVVASVASHAFRVNGLQKLVERFEGKLDKLNIFLLDYKFVPDFLHGKNWINVHQAKGKKEEGWGMWAKFYWTEELGKTAGVYHFILDEDLIYPANYVSVMVDRVENYNRKAVIGIHGRRFLQGNVP